MEFVVFMLIVAAIVLFIMLINEKKKSERIRAYLFKLLRQNRISLHEYESVINGIGDPDMPPVQNIQNAPTMPNMPPVWQQAQQSPPPPPPAAPTQTVQTQQGAQPAAADPQTVTGQTMPQQTAFVQQPDMNTNVRADEQRTETEAQSFGQQQAPAAMTSTAGEQAQYTQQTYQTPPVQPFVQPQAVPPVQTYVPQQPMPQQNMGWQPMPMYMQGQPTPNPRINMPTQFPPKPQRAADRPPKKLNSAAVLLFIGVAFVILAGIIFSTAAWHTMSDLQRVGLVAGAAAFFFAVSEFARRKLKLISTGLAFYMLGGVFTGISFLSLGYFNLMGEWFSTGGDGSFAVFSAFALIVTGFSAGASGLYKRAAFTHAALYGAAVSLSLVALQITDDMAGWALTLNCVAAIPLFLTYRGAKVMGEKNDPIFRSFSIILTVLYALTAMPGLLANLAGEWKTAHMLTVALWTAELIFYAIKLDNDLLRGIYPAAALALIAEAVAALNLSATDSGGEIKCVIAATAMLVVFTVCRMVKKLSSAAADGIFFGGIFCSAIACSVYDPDISAVIYLMTFAAAAVIAHGLGGASEAEQKVFRMLSPIPAAIAAGLAGELLWDKLSDVLGTSWYTDIYISYLYHYDPLEPFIVAVMLLLLAYGYRFSGRAGLKLRSGVSDFLLAASAAIVTAAITPDWGYRGGPTVYQAAASGLLALLAATYVFERKPRFRQVTYIMRRVFPLTAMYFIYRLSLCSEEILYRTSGADEEYRLVVRAAIYILLGAAVMMCFINIRKIRTLFSDLAVPFCIALQCFELSSGYSELTTRLAAATSWAALSVMLLYEGMDRDRSGHLAIVRAASPFSLIMVNEALRAIFRRDLSSDETFAGIIIITLMLAAAAVFAANARASSVTEADRNDDNRLFAQLQYIWSAAAGFVLIGAAGEAGDSRAAAIILVGICVIFYLLAESFKNNLPAAFPLIAIFSAATEVTGYMEYSVRQDRNFIVSVILFVAFAVCSRIFHHKKFIDSKPLQFFKIDLPAAAMVFAAIMTFSSSGGRISDKGAAFVAVIEMSVFWLNLIRDETHEKFNRIAISVSSAMLCGLIWVQPFGDIESNFILWKLNIMPLVLFGLIFRRIWKDQPKLVSDTFVLFVTAFGLLLIDALVNQSLGNTIFVLSVTLVIMLVSFGVKSGRWFIISSASFLGLTLYITRDFLAAVQWWVYLLAAGILLIAIASANEYLKTRGENLKDKITEMKDEWK